MFGIGFTELILISIVAILFLGPDKLPETLVDIAKFIKNIKKSITEAKDSFEEEIKMAELKKEALGYKKQLDDATAELKNFKNISLDSLADEIYDDEVSEISPMDHVKATQDAKNANRQIQEPPQELSDKTTPDENQNTNLVETKNTTVTFKKKKKSTTRQEKKSESKKDKN